VISQIIQLINVGGKVVAWRVKRQNGGLKNRRVKKNKSKKNESANNTEKADQSNNKLDNYAMFSYTLSKNTSALICTSDFKHEAHSITKSNGRILDCSASSHFTPERSKLLNYREISPEPICSADGHTFSATRKGDLKLELPNGD
jgi:hypothetical protein